MSYQRRPRDLSASSSWPAGWPCSQSWPSRRSPDIQNEYTSYDIETAKYGDFSDSNTNFSQAANSRCLCHFLKL